MWPDYFIEEKIATTNTASVVSRKILGIFSNEEPRENIFSLKKYDTLEGNFQIHINNIESLFRINASLSNKADQSTSEQE